ncbi:HNH endonuclease [Bartonella sp. DGB1]|uniref:HNH endonuclease n=2 Tax=Bartonella sp. DGB1 TaxID=3239807 RepID=UPI003523BBE3
MKISFNKSSIGSSVSSIGFIPRVKDSFYSSMEWLSLRKQALKRACYKCSWCNSTKRLYVDHIKEIKDGGSRTDLGNLQVLCASCHNKKTSLAKKMRQNN